MREPEMQVDLYQLLLDNANDAIAVVTLDGVVLEANRRWEQILGLPRGGLVGSTIGDFSAPGYEAASLEQFSADVRMRASLPSPPVPIRGGDGHIVLMAFTSSVIDLGGQPAVMTIGRDVTACVRTLEQLRRTETRHRQLIERLPDVVWSSNARGEISFITANVTAITGYTPEEVCAGGVELWFSRIHTDERARARAEYDRFMAGEDSFDHEYRIRHRSGRWVWLRTRSSGKYVQDGVLCCDGVMVDITRQRELEESLRQSHKLEAVGQLAGGVAHDFNNLLAVILADSSMLSDELGPDDPRQADAVEIRQAAERAAVLTRQLLTFSRKQVLSPEALDLDTVTRELAKMLGRLIGEDQRLIIRPGHALATVEIDRGQLEQIIVNLAVNARDAMPGGGTITIATRNQVLDQSLTSATGELPAGGYVVLSVSDTGHGIAPEVLPRIFEPFFTTKGPTHGTGLGLATVYGAVTQARGAVAVHSEPGAGACFEVYLPRVAPRTARAPAPGDRQRRPPVRETVLLVEDEDTVRAVCRRSLQGAGYYVLEARSGAEAITLLAGEHVNVDLVITDVVMPGLSGPDMVRALELRRPGLKVLYMSGYADHQALRGGGLGDGKSFLCKPFAGDALLDKVREVLQLGISPRSG